MRMMENQLKDETSEQPAILVVDDDEFMRDLLFRYLDGRGYSVSVAETGERAIALVQTHTFDVGLVDIVLSRMSGVQLVDALKNVQPDIILVMMTGHPSLETALETMKRGVQDYLIKPFKLAQLDSLLQRCLERRKILLENRRLRGELEEAKERLKTYETLIRQPHMVQAQSETDRATDRVRGDVAYRFQSHRNRKTVLQDWLNKLVLLREEGVISEDEFEIRRQQLLASGGEIRDEGVFTGKTES